MRDPSAGAEYSTRISPACRRSSAEGVVSKVASLLRVARIMAPVLSPMRRSPIVRPAIKEPLGTLNSSGRNLIPLDTGDEVQKIHDEGMGRERGEPPPANGVGREGAIGSHYLELGC